MTSPIPAAARGPWIRLCNGQPFFLLDPSPDQVDLRTLVHALACTTRFCGHTHTPYSVAQHSLLVADLLPARLMRHGLAHDLHEALIGGVSSPMKMALRILEGQPSEGVGGYDLLRRLEDPIIAAVHVALGLSWPLPAADQARVRAADLTALATEMRDLMPVADLAGLPPPAPIRIRPMGWAKAEEAWLHRWQLLADAECARAPAVAAE
jgi:hypothetical protein